MIDDKAVKVIQNRVNSFSAPPSITRIPYKIASSFPSLTADQLRIWTNIYSLLALHDILPSDHLECWRHFVLASRIFAKRSLSNNDIQVADALLMRFCNRVERLYGKPVITSNMHMHGHLKQCIVDYGPVYNFWLYSLKRYNGILEGYPTNSFSVEVKLFMRFQREFSLASIALPQEFNSDFNDVFQNLLSCDYQGSLQATVSPDIDNVEDVKLPKSFVRSTIDEQQTEEIKGMLLKLNAGVEVNNIEVNTVVN